MNILAQYAVFLAAPLGFAFMWTLVCFITAGLGGWSKLAGRFRAAEEPEGEIFSMQSGRFRFMNYNSVLKIIPANRGLYLSVFFLFRPFHPPLLVPWEAIRNVRWKSVLFFKYVSFDIVYPERLLTVSLSRRVAESSRWQAEKPA